MLTVPKLADRLGVHANTVRRDVYERFPEFFNPDKINGIDQFSEESLIILQKIKELRRDGKKRHEIKEVLRKTGFPVFEPGQDAVEVHRSPGQNMKIEIELGPKTLAAINNLADSLRVSRLDGNE